MDLNLRAFEDERAAQALRGALFEGDAAWAERKERVNQAWSEKDIEGVFVWLGDTYHMGLVFDNWPALKEHGVYEKALLHAYSSTRINFASWSPGLLHLLFQMADRARLLCEGDPLPGEGPFTVYRGVSGIGAKRRRRGISWTGSLDKAKWFAQRFPLLEKPMVYCVTVGVEHVYAYDNGREEQEFLCDIPKDIKLKKVWP